MASGLGGREGMGREGEDMLTTGAPTGASTGASTGPVLVSFLPVYQDCRRARGEAQRRTSRLGVPVPLLLRFRSQRKAVIEKL